MKNVNVLFVTMLATLLLGCDAMRSVVEDHEVTKKRQETEQKMKDVVFEYLQAGNTIEYDCDQEEPDYQNIPAGIKRDSTFATILFMEAADTFSKAFRGECSIDKKQEKGAINKFRLAAKIAKKHDGDPIITDEGIPTFKFPKPADSKPLKQLKPKDVLSAVLYNICNEDVDHEASKKLVRDMGSMEDVVLYAGGGFGVENASERAIYFLNVISNKVYRPLIEDGGCADLKSIKMSTKQRKEIGLLSAIALNAIKNFKENKEDQLGKDIVPKIYTNKNGTLSVKAVIN